jgi:hypothetical protein
LDTQAGDGKDRRRTTRPIQLIADFLPNTAMAFADVLPHAAYELSLFLSDDEKRRLCLASQTVHDACSPYRNSFNIPLATSSQ